MKRPSKPYIKQEWTIWRALREANEKVAWERKQWREAWQEAHQEARATWRLTRTFGMRLPEP